MPSQADLEGLGVRGVFYTQLHMHIAFERAQERDRVRAGGTPGVVDY